ncbi:MAG: bifunctional glutamate N-acetyltransferase/amino-acid acetyltransferase ArgJ [Elusimicrobiota bacterium]|nr:bifunctional glutamate N-acetyltransferase/amino-acid acetyltransferase ArgJ [Elusimicrobiota bacterium]
MKIKDCKFSGIKAGIKKDKFDLGLIYFTEPSTCVAAFTKNLLKSNSIIVSERHLKKTGHIRCIIANSGCANTACGNDGIDITEQICKVLAEKLNLLPEEILVASTGVIGEPLPKEKILSNLDHLISSLGTGKGKIFNFARAIMTTDTKPKVVYKSLKMKSQKGNILCIAKGAGMIAPDLCLNKQHATMLVFLLTDFLLCREQMEQLMQHIIVPTFNSFSIDGDTSPNDTIFFVTTNISNNVIVKDKEFKELVEHFKIVCEEIVWKLLSDGEGVTKVIKIIIKNSESKNAEKIAKTIANSLLVKTAFHGADPNWGRILSCCGRSNANIDINKINIWIGKHQVVKNGTSNFVKDSLVRKEMKKKFFEIIIDAGNTYCKNLPYSFFTTDLSKEYVEINSQYKT